MQGEDVAHGMKTGCAAGQETAVQGEGIAHGEVWAVPPSRRLQCRVRV